MILWILRVLILVAGPVIGYFQFSPSLKAILIGLGISATIVAIELILEYIPLDTLIIAILGIILGLVGAKLLDYTVYLMDNPRLYEVMKDYSLWIKIILAYLGLIIAVRKKNELDLLDKDILYRAKKRRQQEQILLLDTSAIIDGRILDIAETKFLSGILVIPRFILDELQFLSDSPDSQKRSRGRRGLDIINQLKSIIDLNLKIVTIDFPETKEVDSKLVKLARQLNARIITTDFNLNKIASLEGVVVLNVNDLANALKPIYLPGEKMAIFVVKEGKDPGQGVGYLDDGTMVVVDDGRRYIGNRIDVVVTSILQTSSGRLIFTRPEQNGNATSRRRQ